MWLRLKWSPSPQHTDSHPCTRPRLSVSRGVWGKTQEIRGNILPFLGHFYVKFMEIICSKAPGNYSASFELFTLRFAYGRTQKPSFLSFRHFQTCPRLPKPISFIFGDTRILQIIQENPESLKTNICIANHHDLEIEQLAPGNHEEPS